MKVESNDDDEQLPDLLVERHLLQRGCRPTCSAALSSCERSRRLRKARRAGRAASCETTRPAEARHEDRSYRRSPGIAGLDIIVSVSVDRAPRRTRRAAMRCFVLTISDTRTADDRHQRRRASPALLERRGARHRRPAHRARRPGDGARRVVAEQAAGADVVITTGGTGITSRDSTYEAIDGAAREAARRLRRAVPDAQLQRDRLRRDAEPRLRRHDRPDGRLRAARLGARRHARR